VEILSFLWNEVLLRPMTNGLLLLAVVASNFAVGIILFTIIVRVVTLPLTIRQLRQSKAMAELQPKIQDVQKRFAGDRQRLSQETLRLYKQAGVSPVGCLGPLVIQFPIWIALYYGLTKALPSTPERLSELSHLLYSWAGPLHTALPFSSNFLWLDLATPDRLPIMPVLVGISMWVLQKMSTYPTTDPRTQQTNNIMLWMMPLMFMFFTFSFPSGLALYWFISNVVGIVLQYFVTGWGGLATLWQRKGLPAPAPALPAQPAGELTSDGATDRGERQNGGRGNRAGSQAARRKKGRGTG
jgi:YidC/Oxa1 family membrane protein insertase